jgi:hypothetical protein
MDRKDTAMLEFLLSIPGVVFTVSGAKQPDAAYVLLALRAGRLAPSDKVGLRTTVHFAIEKNHRELFDYLLIADPRVDVELSGKGFMTERPLTTAVTTGKMEFVRKILE